MNWVKYIAIGASVMIIAFMVLVLYGAAALSNEEQEPEQAKKEETNIEPSAEVSSDEVELMARIVDLEAGGESPLCMKMVASVLVNRMRAGWWGRTMTEVISFPNAFTSYNYLDRCPNASAAAFAAVEAVLCDGPIAPAAVMYFRDDYDFNWEGYKNYCVIDNIYFGYFINGDH